MIITVSDAFLGLLCNIVLMMASRALLWTYVIIYQSVKQMTEWTMLTYLEHLY